LRFARDSTEKTASCFLERFDGTIGQRVTLPAPKFPPDVARHIFGIEFQPIQNESRCLHDIIANSVTGHPRNFVFSHRESILAARHRVASKSISELRITRTTLIRLTEGDKGNEDADIRTPTFAAFVIFCSRSVRAKPRGHELFSAARDKSIPEPRDSAAERQMLSEGRAF
jgi:hypothetical protein